MYVLQLKRKLPAGDCEVGWLSQGYQSNIKWTNVFSRARPFMTENEAEDFWEVYKPHLSEFNPNDQFDSVAVVSVTFKPTKVLSL